MKKIIFSLLAACIVLFTSCGATGMAVDSVTYMEYLKAGDYEKFVENFTPALDADTKAMFVESLEAVEEANGLISDYVVKESGITEDGKQAQVIYTVTYENGETLEYPMGLELVGNDWKMLQ